jgi:hypothetical protein
MTTQNKIEFIQNEFNQGYTRIEFEQLFQKYN